MSPIPVARGNPLITMQVHQKVLRASSATAARQVDRHVPSDAAPKKKPLRLVKSSAA